MGESRTTELNEVADGQCFEMVGWPGWEHLVFMRLARLLALPLVWDVAKARTREWPTSCVPAGHLPCAAIATKNGHDPAAVGLAVMFPADAEVTPLHLVRTPLFERETRPARFTVCGTVPLRDVDETFEGLDLQRAIERTRERRGRDVSIESVEMADGRLVGVVGFDEGTGEVIVEGDKFAVDGDGCYLLQERTCPYRRELGLSTGEVR